MTAGSLAARLGRHRDTVIRAVQRGRLPSVGVDGNGRPLIRVDAEDLCRWRRQSLREVLAVQRSTDPSLPSDLRGWRTGTDVVKAFATRWPRAMRWLTRARVPVLEWDTDTPFQAERRYFIADLAAAAAQLVARGAATSRRGADAKRIGCNGRQTLRREA